MKKIDGDDSDIAVEMIFEPDVQIYSEYFVCFESCE